MQNMNEDEAVMFMSISLYLKRHPFLDRDFEFRKQYYERLEYFVGKYCQEEAFSAAVLKNYHTLFLREKFCRDKVPPFSCLGKRKMLQQKKAREGKSKRFFYCYMLAIDCLFLCAFLDEERGRLILCEIKKQFDACRSSKLDLLCDVLYHGKPIRSDLWMVADIIYCWRKNMRFLKKPLMRIMVTANMSAGKSTFINVLAGKNISLSRTMACTAKIHSIVSKPYEDGYEYEYDHDLVLEAGPEELLWDNALNASDRIIASTYYDSALGGSRLLIDDSPGVNYFGDAEHKEISRLWIQRQDYDLLIYLMDATQLGTTDDAEHLEFVKKNAGRKKVLFVMNKIDAFDIEEEDVESVIQRQREHLEQIGFKNPSICPVSSKAGWLAKRYENGKLARFEQKEFDVLADKFEQMRLPEYYQKYFPKVDVLDSKGKGEELLKNCGIAYIEQIIKKKVQSKR